MTVVWSKVESKINSLLKGLPLDRSSDPKSHARIDHSSDHRKSNSSQECMIPQIMGFSKFMMTLLKGHRSKNQTTSQGLRKQVGAPKTFKMRDQKRLGTSPSFQASKGVSRKDGLCTKKALFPRPHHTC